jgi:hypothetical protein
MTPEKSALILRGVVGSLELWIGELQQIERACAACPGRVAHLLASMKQGHRALRQLIERDSAD